MPLHKAALTQRANDPVITGVECAGAKGDICLQLVPAREGDVRTSQVIYGYAKVRVESEAGSAAAAAMPTDISARTLRLNCPDFGQQHTRSSSTPL